MTRFLNGISILNSMAETYEGPCLFLFAAAAGLVLLAVFGGRKSRDAFLYPCLILMFTVFNPLILDTFYKGAKEETASHIVFFWAVPVALIIAAAAVSLGSAFRNPFLRVLPSALMIALAITTGVPDISAYTEIRMPSNLLKADPGLVSLIAFMDEKSASDMYSVAFEDSALRYQAEEYSAEIELSDLFLAESDTEDAVSFRRAATKYDPDFLVVDRGGSADNLLQNLNYTELAHTDTCSVYAGEA